MSSLNLSDSSFLESINLPVREQEILDHWYAEDLYGAICDRRTDAPVFTLHDGPPYANGHVHLGTALNKLLKDIVIKFKTMEGYRVPFLPGWDCHGLPIEHGVLDELGVKAKSMSNLEIRSECGAYAERYVSIMRDEFKRLGILGEWERPYLTMSKTYEAVCTEELQQLILNRKVYCAEEPVNWCWSCQTALDGAEVEQIQEPLRLIWLKFSGSEKLRSLIPEQDLAAEVEIIVATDRLWTLPACTALVCHSRSDYVIFENDGSVYLTVSSRFKETVEICGFSSPKILIEIPGTDLNGILCRHPLYDRDVLMVCSDYLHEAGFGISMVSPAYGFIDHHLGVQHNLDVFEPVTPAGFYRENLALFGGSHITECEPLILDQLDLNNNNLAEQQFTGIIHRCWRCESRVIIKKSRQWFLSLMKDNLAGKAAALSTEVDWTPARCGDAIEKSTLEAHNWCISRQRFWGIPLTIFTCEKCGEILVNPDVSHRIVESVRLEGGEAWFTGENHRWIEPGTVCKSCGHPGFSREKSMMDVWMESGMSHRAVLTSENGLSWPASLYLESIDQLRGWFRASLLMAVANHGKSPFDSVLVHGFVLDSYGGKMSKSAGNMVQSRDLVNDFGADILRLWLASVNYTENIPFSTDVLLRTADKYRWWRSAFEKMLRSISDFNPAIHAVPYEDLEEMDKYLLISWSDVLDEITRAYGVYAFHHVIRIIENFIRNILSSIFGSRSHEIMTKLTPDDPVRRSGQTAICVFLNELIRSMAPLLVFTMEELWYYLPGTEGSVHCQDFPLASEPPDADNVRQHWHDIQEIRKNGMEF